MKVENFDTALLKKAQLGDTDAFETIITKYERLIINVAYRMLGNLEDARDTSQEVCIKIFKNLSKCDSIENLEGWICRITHNACIDEIRKQNSRPKATVLRAGNDGETLDPLSILPTDEGIPERAFDEKESLHQLEAAIMNIDERHRQLIVLRDIEGFSYQEISEAIDMPMGTVKSRISRARAALAQSLTLMRNK